MSVLLKNGRREWEIMILSRLRNYFRLRSIKNNFLKKSSVSPDTVFMLGASCRNSGDRSSVSIAGHCTVGAAFLALYGGKISVGKNTYIGAGTSIQSKDSISIGENVIIANNVLLIDNNNHPTAPEMRLKMSQCDSFLTDELWSWKYADSLPIVIEDNVWIGRDSRILKGVTVGKGSIVALGAIVTHDGPPYCVVAGNPAKVVKRLAEKESGE